MDLFNKMKKAIKNPYLFIPYLGGRGHLKWLPDDIYLKAIYRARLHKKLNLKNPVTFNEKLQWLKINDRKPEYTRMVDKYEVRKYIGEQIGEEYLIPLLGVYNTFEEIDFEKLPNQFVLKCTHDSGGLVICKDKSKLNIEEAKEKINKSMNRNYYYNFREWPYKNVKPRIVCEKYMVDESGYELKDYKFFCFDGIVKAMFIATDREIDTRFDFFDTNFKHIPVEQGYKNSAKKINRPKNLDHMIQLSELLSKGIRHIRVDFYEIDGMIYFGELTFYHFSGFKEFVPNKYDEIFGDWLEL